MIYPLILAAGVHQKAAATVQPEFHPIHGNNGTKPAHLLDLCHIKHPEWLDIRRAITFQLRASTHDTANRARIQSEIGDDHSLSAATSVTTSNDRCRVNVSSTVPDINGFMIIVNNQLRTQHHNCANVKPFLTIHSTYHKRAQQLYIGCVSFVVVQMRKPLYIEFNPKRLRNYLRAAPAHAVLNITITGIKYECTRNDPYFSVCPSMPHICIDNRLFCDYTDNCGNLLDEQNCEPPSPPPTCQPSPTEVARQIEERNRARRIKTGSTFIAYMSPFILIFIWAFYLTVKLAKDDFHNRKAFVEFFHNYYAIEQDPKATSFKRLGLFGDLDFNKEKKAKKRQPKTLQAMLLNATESDDEEDRMIELVRKLRYDRRHRRNRVDQMLAMMSQKRSLAAPISPLAMANLYGQASASGAVSGVSSASGANRLQAERAPFIYRASLASLGLSGQIV